MNINNVNINHMHHRNAPDTERQAAMSVSHRVSGLRYDCLMLLYDRIKLSGGQAYKILGELEYSIKPRFTELRNLGLVEDSTERAVNDRGGNEIVWRLTSAGHMLAEHYLNNPRQKDE